MFSDDYKYYLWKTVHIFVYIVQQIIRSYNGIMTNIRYSFNKSTKSDKVLIDECKQLCDKIPKHIVLILGERQLDFSSISNIIFWASLADIKCISIYDYTGKKIHITLQPYVERVNDAIDSTLCYRQSQSCDYGKICFSRY